MNEVRSNLSRIEEISKVSRRSHIDQSRAKTFCFMAKNNRGHIDTNTMRTDLLFRVSSQSMRLYISCHTKILLTSDLGTPRNLISFQNDIVLI